VYRTGAYVQGEDGALADKADKTGADAGVGGQDRSTGWKNMKAAAG
jgi:hypothetical protein